jgi:hypothetical protein
VTLVTRKSFISALGLAFAGAALAQDREREQRDQRDQRDQKENRGQEHGRAEYHFRHEDAGRLRQHYPDMEHVDTRHRGRLVAGERLTGDWRERIRPVPVDVVRELPPAPPGVVFGYIDGYVIAYDPDSGYISDVLDLAGYR